ncbi:hypothetical protein ACJX0J_013810, partial [Zea mays]
QSRKTVDDWPDRVVEKMRIGEEDRDAKKKGIHVFFGIELIVVHIAFVMALI